MEAPIGCSSMIAAIGVVMENADLAKSRNGKYLLISPCRDEAGYMRETLDSVIGQSVRPANQDRRRDDTSTGSAGRTADERMKDRSVP